MWYFSAPQIVFGDGALAHLAGLTVTRAAIVTDPTLLRLGYAQRICDALPAGTVTAIFDAVEPDPSLGTALAGADFLRGFAPDWIIAVGGGSVIDAAKAMWILYENPQVDPASINPIETYHLRAKARFAALPTTSGTGSEATWAIVLTDTAERRKLGLGSREAVPDLAILDPEFVRQLPARLTADTGLDALVHAVEGYTSTFHNDFCDGLCLQAARLVFTYLPRAYADGSDMQAREHLQNAATIAGLGFGNSMAALAHGMGHALGGVFHVPHGRAVALFLPYTIEFSAAADVDNRYADLAAFLALPPLPEGEGAPATALAAAIRDLERSVDQPLTLREAGIPREQFEAELDLLVMNAMNDTQTLMSARIPDEDEMRALFWKAYGNFPLPLGEG
jgi:alcohol dehydrogenase class IV